METLLSQKFGKWTITVEKYSSEARIKLYNNDYGYSLYIDDVLNWFYIQNDSKCVLVMPSEVMRLLEGTLRVSDIV